MLYFDSNYLLFVILPTVILSGLAQFFVRSAYNKWTNTPNANGLKGPEVAQRLMRDHQITVDLEQVPNNLGDHYDPQTHTVRMSPSVAQTASVASMAIVAHELGHALQHQENSILIGMRNFLLPAVRFSPMLSYGLIFAGLFFNATGLAWAGIVFFGVSVLFMLLTLPVEFDASRRGLKILEQSGLMIADTDRNGSRQMLTAAALTYVAAAVTSLLQLLYYINLVSRRD
jgi:Zn-dependent membrane protease YugP